jgi:SAM-dependent methyltransferase
MNSRIPFDACPLCQGRAIKPLRSGDCSKHPLYNQIIPPVMNWLRCNDCSHVFTDGYFPPDVLAKVFQRTHENQKPGWNFEQQRWVSARLVENVARYVNAGAWLDVGFGNGSLLFTAEEWGFDPVGLDLRPPSVEAMRKLGVEAHCFDVTAFDSSKRFSVVSMADVLEHMPFPKDGLAAAHRLLAADGMLFVSMPNYGCAAWRLLDAVNANPYWGELEHYHNFSRARLYALLIEYGFEPLHYRVSERYRICMEVIARRR